MDTIKQLFFLIILMTCVFSDLAAKENTDEKLPNIVVFLVDDLGWNDTSLPFHDKPTKYNARYRTPELERLAEQGLTFTNAHSQALCVPSRASLLTGQNFNNQMAENQGIVDRGVIEVGGYKLKYVVKGKGTPCLVIGSSVYYPKTFSEELHKHLKIYYVDMRWFAPGLSGEQVNEFNIRNVARDIEEIRQFLKLEKPVLMGHSIHGTVAMEYARLFPENVSSLVLIGSPNRFGNPFFDKTTASAWKKASESRKELQNKNWNELSKISAGLTEAERVVEEYCTMAPSYWFDPTYDAHWLWEGVNVRSHLLRPLYSNLFNNYSMFANKNRAPVPTLVILGKYDFVIPPSLWEPDKNMENVTTVILKKSGHTPQLEESKKFNTILLNWLLSNNEKK